MQQTFISKSLQFSSLTPLFQTTNILNFHESYQQYQLLTRKFHRITLYIFCSIQIIFIVLCFNIISLNQYNQFISQYQQNLKQKYSQTYLKNHQSQIQVYAGILQNVNQLVDNKMMVYWLIWIAHVGSCGVLAYIAYANRFYFKQYLTGVRQILPIFFTLLTTFVVRDCLLMSATETAQSGLDQIMFHVESLHEQFLTNDASFVPFIETSLLSVNQQLGDLNRLSILTYIQQICDMAIVTVLTVQIFRIYIRSSRCVGLMQQMKDLQQFPIQPLKKPLPAAPHRFPNLLKKFLQQPHLTSHHFDNQPFSSQKHISHSQRQFVGSPIENSFKGIVTTDKGMRDMFHHHPFHSKHNQLQPLFQKPMMKKSKSNNNFKKMQKSGCWNYLKGSSQISENFNVNKSRPAFDIDLDLHQEITKLKVRKQSSMGHIQLNKLQKATGIANHQKCLTQGQRVVFQV